MNNETESELIQIQDFMEFNYENIALDITGVDRKLLLSRLKSDYINHLYELEDSKYIAIWNCDLQGFADINDIYFVSYESTYELAKLTYKDGVWYYCVTNVLEIPEN